MPARKPLALSADGMMEEMSPDELQLAGEYTNVIPLPRELAEHMFFCQGRGMRISADYRLLDTTQFSVDTDSLSLKETVRNLRVWLEDEVWEWDTAGQAWLRHKTFRG